MKKLLISLGLALALLSPTSSRAQETVLPKHLAPGHIDTYDLTSTVGTFTDISTNPDAKALGSDLAENADLKNVLLHRWGSATIASGAYDSATPGIPLGFKFNMFGREMTHFAVSAFGGVYFDETDSLVNTYSTAMTGMGRYAVWAHPYLRKNATSSTTAMAVAGFVFKDGNTAPAHYLIEGTENNHVLTVQHHYQVLGDGAKDNWTFQFKFYEATGKIEFIVKTLEYENGFEHATKGKNHRILLAFTEFANGTVPSPFTNIYDANNLRTPNVGNNYLIFFKQTEAQAANGWGNFEFATSLSGEASTMCVNANGPEEGRTLSFTPKQAPQPLEAFTSDYYNEVTNNKLKTTLTATSYTVHYQYNKDKFATATDFENAGSIVAVLSKSPTPDYTFGDAGYYLKGYEFDVEGTQGFKPRIIANQMPKPQTFNRATGEWAYATSATDANLGVELTATGLTASTKYYIHLHRMAYIGTGAPVYSPVCHTIEFLTAFGSPKSIKTVGLATTDAVNVEVTSDPQAQVLLIKSPKLKIAAPSGKLQAGDKLAVNGSETEKAEVVGIFPQGTTTQEIAMAKGEGCFIMAYSVNITPAESEAGEDTYSYSPGYVYVGVGTAYDGLPGLVDFTKMPYGNPNFELDGMDVWSTTGKLNWAKLAPSTYLDLPFGFTRSEVTGDKSNAFGLGKPASKETSILYAKAVKNMDLITPPIVVDNDRISMTFNARWVMLDDRDEWFDDISYGKETNTDTICQIDYAIGDGEWQKGKVFLGYDEAFLARDDNGYYAITYALIANEGESLIGKTVRFRFTTKNTISGSFGSSGRVLIGSIDIKEDKICKTSNNIVLDQALTTNNQLGLQWYDLNIEELSPAESFEIAYKPANDENAEWLTANSNKANVVIKGLEPFTTYAVRVTANCGQWGIAYQSFTYKHATFNAFPFADSLKQDFAYDESIKIIAGQLPIERGFTTMTGALPETGSASLSTPDFGWKSSYSSNVLVNNDKISKSVAISERDKNGWLLTPAIYIPNDYAQYVRFSANAFYKDGAEDAEDKTWHQGTIHEKYADAKLYVVIGHNGNFSMADTVGTLPVGQMTFDENGNDFEFKLPLDEGVTGFVQVGFYLSNPKGSAGTQSTSNDDLMIFEIWDLEFAYDGTPCFGVDSLTRTNTTKNSVTYTWKRNAGDAAKYRVYWGPADQEIFTDSINTTEQTITLTGLTEATAYKLAVAAFCSEDDSHRAPKRNSTFSTPEACHTPTDITVTDITSDEATFNSINKQSILVKREVFLAEEGSETERVFNQDEDALKLTDLKKNMNYTVRTRAVCEQDSSAMSEPVAFRTLNTFVVTLNVLPDAKAGSVEGAGTYDEGTEVTVTATANENYAFEGWVNGEESLSKEASYTFNVTEDVTYTAVFAEQDPGTEANEAAVRAAFNVSTKEGHLLIQNLKGLTIEEVTVYGLTGRQLGHFTPNSREDLSLPINAERSLLLVRVASEQGVAIYKVYLH